jgi:lysophospholipase L1-like esterase
MNVLLLGDSIRMGYQPFVQELLQGAATVTGPEGNCEDSGTYMCHLDAWLVPADVIHFNCGLHDIKIDRQAGVCKTSLAQYRENLRIICERLRKTGARLIWATTTPVIYERHVRKGFDRREEDVLAYNQAALDVIRGFDIAVNDLHQTVVTKGTEMLLGDDGVHFGDWGSRLLAQAVVRAVGAAMPRI